MWVLGIVFWMGAVAATSALADDGEGTARVVSPKVLAAGSRARVVVEVTVGSSGIPVGGGVTLGLHHAAQWPDLQSDKPDAPGYISAACATPDNLDVTWHGWAPGETFTRIEQTGFSDSMCHQLALARVTREPLQPGERVAFIIGANEHLAEVQQPADQGHEFHVMTDTNADGVYAGIAVQPRLDIVAGPAHHLAAVAPSTVVAGEPIELLVRAEDRYFNLASGCSGMVNLLDEQGEVVAVQVALKSGLGRTTAQFTKPGPYRLKVKGSGLDGRCNPFRVFDTAPPYRIYWGDIHGHTSISDGLGADATEYFTFGRNVSRLDVCALTDHGHFDWPQTINAVKGFYEPGRFVTILAQEAGAGPDHINIYHRGDDTPHIQGWPSTYDVFFAAVLAQYNESTPIVAVGPHHFTYDRGDDRYPFGLWDTRVARFVEVYSSHGTSEYLGNPRPCPGARDERKFMQWGLARGLRFGVIGASDNHDSHPGRTIWGHYPGGLAAFLAPELTREAIWDAFWNYRVYATGFDRIYLEFTVDDRMMGSEVVAAEPCRIRYYVIGRTDALTVHLIRNNEELLVDRTLNGFIEADFEDLPPAGENFYYLRVVQDNGERAWSSPIWVAR